MLIDPHFFFFFFFFFFVGVGVVTMLRTSPMTVVGDRDDPYTRVLRQLKPASLSYAFSTVSQECGSSQVAITSWHRVQAFLVAL